MMQKKFLIALAFAMQLVVTFGQDQWALDKIVPPSPTAAALGAYGDLPVSHFTGQPAINIPIHTIRTAQHKVDISLSYNSNVRVNQDASWVGLGWSLNSGGGLITRTIRGQDDFNSVSYPDYNTGYYKADALPPPDASFMPPQLDEDPLRTVSAQDPAMEYLEDVIEGRIDTEPDIFYYNFAGYSGRFVLGKEANGAVVFEREQSDLKIEINFNIPHRDYGEWKVTTPEGYIYAFGTPELSENVTAKRALEESEMVGLGPYTGVILGDQVGGPYAFKRTMKDQATSWYLDYIEAPNGDRINFNYTTFGKYLSNINITQQAYDQVYPGTIAPGDSEQDPGGQTTCEDVPTGFSLHVIDNLASRQIIQEVVLASITFDGGRVEFETGQRKDVETFDGGNGGRELEEINIYNGTEWVKSFYFIMTILTPAFRIIRGMTIQDSECAG